MLSMREKYSPKGTRNLYSKREFPFLSPLGYTKSTVGRLMEQVKTAVRAGRWRGSRLKISLRRGSPSVKSLRSELHLLFLICSCAGVPPCTLPLRAAFGLTEDARGPRSALRPRPPPRAFVALQRDAQVVHHGAQSYALAKTRQ